MRGEANPQTALFSYVSLEERVPRDHPLRKLRILVDAVLATMDADFTTVYAKRGRPSIPPEFLLRASLIQILYTVRSERQLVEQIDFNLLFRWFVGLSIDDRVWDHSTFSHNRERLFDEGMARKFFERVKLIAEWQELVSDEHFSVEGPSSMLGRRTRASCPRTSRTRRTRGVVATARSTSRARSAATTPTPAPPIQTRVCTASPRPPRHACATWALRSWKPQRPGGGRGDHRGQRQGRTPGRRQDAQAQRPPCQEPGGGQEL